jgi:hypothetical protein
VTRPAEHARPHRPRRPATEAANPDALRAIAPGSVRPGRQAAMTRPPFNPNELVDAATAVARTRAARHQRLWAMTREERIAAFYRGELTFSDCLAWSRCYPDEPPTGPCGEYLYILATTPEWLGEA